MKRSILYLAFFFLSLAACKKNDGTLTFLSGTLTIDSTPEVCLYHAPGEVFFFRPGGLQASDGTPVAYYFTDPLSGTKDTIMTAAHPGTAYRYEVPDVLKTLKINCVGFADGSSKYYTTSASCTFTVVDSTLNSGSLRDFPAYPEDVEETFFGTSYATARIGGRCWMRQNLAHVTATSGIPYEASPVMRKVFGGYYTWREAQRACPDGWRLPSEEDWMDLAHAAGVPEPRAFEPFPSGAGALMGQATFNGTRLWDFYREVSITDASHFSALPVGYAVLVEDAAPVFADMHGYAAFWTADEQDGQGVYRYLTGRSDVVHVALASKDGLALSVRCVRDVEMP
ncbi:MAG: fibrobacter succinogenes major paralogous domain-containing protein [Bacteroidales bacterium]|nr:fibrobacter succinogenes major paralogous domain-containing protein [Bacteroidales bacterium]